MTREYFLKFDKETVHNNSFASSFSYQPPHVRRRIKVQEMMQKYKKDMTEPELLADLFKASI